MCTGAYHVYFWTNLHEILAPCPKSNFQAPGSVILTLPFTMHFRRPRNSHKFGAGECGNFGNMSWKS